MKILIVGGGGREHALAWRLTKSPSVHQVLASPGNPGIEQLGMCLPSPADMAGYASLAEQHRVDLTVVGPEAPLVAGIVDEFQRRGLAIVGPTQKAARLEGSKIFAKQFFERAGIPTARSVQTTSFDQAIAALKQFPHPVVIKADGLAAGKGVVIAESHAQAMDAVQALGPALVIEEFLTGREVSFIALTDGRELYPFPPSQDHKRLQDGDRGPNTGGMGAYCDSAILSDIESAQVLDQVMYPAITQMAKEGCPFTGFLYAGLMMTAGGPKLLEFNVRMGDPETQAILLSSSGDLAQFLARPATEKMRFDRPSVCIVLAAAGYPGSPETGQTITGLQEASANGAVVFHAGTGRRDGKVVTSGGRVLGVTASGANLASALATAYDAVGKVGFPGMQFRSDIGKRGLVAARIPAVGT